jgi:hypothetical protein
MKTNIIMVVVFCVCTIIFANQSTELIPRRAWSNDRGKTQEIDSQGIVRPQVSKYGQSSPLQGKWTQGVPNIFGLKQRF